MGEQSRPGPLPQSWGYGETQAREGWSVERLQLGSGALATVLVQGIGPARWAYVPRGPVPATPEALDAIVGWARERSLARLRVEPEASPALGEALLERGFHQVPSMQPKTTSIVPLRSDEEMLAGFKSKHRYNVRLAARRGVTVESGFDAAELRRQMEGTAERQDISVPSVQHNRNRLELLSWSRVYLARFEGRPIYAIMVARFAGRAYYLHGGGTGEHRELMPSYAVQWAAMREARDAGCADYDLWGIPPSPDPAHPWYGLWQFKIGFGGELVEFAGGWELVLSQTRSRAVAVATALTRAARRVAR